MTAPPIVSEEEASPIDTGYEFGTRTSFSGVSSPGPWDGYILQPRYSIDQGGPSPSSLGWS